MEDIVEEDIFQDDDELDDKELITIVRANPFLYNKSDKLYSNSEVKRVSLGCYWGRIVQKKRVVSTYKINLFEICQMLRNFC